jgi:hypothetical protein
VQQPARIGEQPFAVLGQAVGPPILLEQRLADPLFQPPHLHRHGRLRAMNFVRRPGEAAGVSDGDEGVELVEVERRGHRRDPS